LTKEKSLWVLPAVLVALCDFAITLAGQPQVYWQDHSKFGEANPVFAYLLSIHPAWFLAGAGAWLIGIVLLALLLPRLLSLVWSSSFLLAHSFGVLTWLLYKHYVTFQIVYVYFPAMSCLVIWQAKIYFSRGRDA
jgi:hypothetical protein